MKFVALFAGLLGALSVAQSPAPPSGPAPGAPPPPPAVQPFGGSLALARTQLQELCERAEHERAAEHVASVLAKPDWDLAPERERAEFHYAHAVALGAAQSFAEAALAAHAARGLAGSSELGLASAYNAGTYRLMRAEELRREIPQVREKLALPPVAPPAPGSTPSGPTGAESASDPIATARAAYLAARSDLVERWRAGAAHVDTRANLELVARRLRELDQLDQQQQAQQSDPNQRQDPDQKQDPQKQDQQQNQGQDAQDQQQQDQQQPDPKQQQDPNKPQDQQDQQKDPTQPPDAQQQPPEDSGAASSGDGADPAQPQDERVLTPEEIQRLMQQLERIEDEAAQVQALLRRARRVPVKRDW